jgi:hypothetical protein
MLLEWHPFTPQCRPPKVTCFFSDGCATYWAGWYTSDDGVGIYVPRGDGTAEILSPERFASVKVWAHPGNFIANTNHDPYLWPSGTGGAE